VNTHEKEQYVVDAEGKRIAVLVDIATYEKMRDAYEELGDIKAYDEAKDKVKSEIETGQYSTLDEYLSSREKR
jgi:hypothetical protein